MKLNLFPLLLQFFFSRIRIRIFGRFGSGLRKKSDPDPGKENPDPKHCKFFGGYVCIRRDKNDIYNIFMLADVFMLYGPLYTCHCVHWCVYNKLFVYLNTFSEQQPRKDGWYYIKLGAGCIRRSGFTDSRTFTEMVVWSHRF